MTIVLLYCYPKMIVMMIVVTYCEDQYTADSGKVHVCSGRLFCGLTLAQMIDPEIGCFIIWMTTLTGPIRHILWSLLRQPHWWYRHDWLDKHYLPQLVVGYIHNFQITHLFCGWFSYFTLHSWHVRAFLLIISSHPCNQHGHTKPYIISKYVSRSNLKTWPEH